MAAERFETELMGLVLQLGELTMPLWADIPKLLQSIASIPEVQAALRGNVTAQQWTAALEQLQKQIKKSAALRKKTNAALAPYGVEVKQALDNMMKLLSFHDQNVTFFTNRLIEENRTWITSHPDKSLEIAERVTAHHLDDIFKVFTANIFPVPLNKANAKALQEVKSLADMEAFLSSLKAKPEIASALKDAHKHYVIRALKAIHVETPDKPKAHTNLGAVDLTRLLAKLMDVAENFETKSEHEVAASLAIITGLGLDKILAVKEAEAFGDHEVSLTFEDNTKQTAKAILPAATVATIFKYCISLNMKPATFLRRAQKTMESLTGRMDVRYTDTAPLHTTILESIASSDLIQQAIQRLDDYKTAIQQHIVRKAVDVEDIDLQRQATQLAMIVKKLKNFHVNVRSIRETLKCSQDDAMQLAQMAKDAISAQGGI